MEPTDEWDRRDTGSLDRLYLYDRIRNGSRRPLPARRFCALAGWDMAQLSRAVLASGFLMMTIFSALPTAHASWTVRWEDEV